MNNHQLTRTQIRLRLLAAGFALAAGVAAVVIAILELKGVLA
jgi:hypothetical protein